jgi:anionic cell wall polymer biosynthesis LytR-Cps2A-Psr (LCP) family protein
MTEYKNTNFESRSRYVRRLQSKAAAKARIQIFLTVAGLSVALLLVSIVAVNFFVKASKAKKVAVKNKPVQSILVLGVEQKQYDQYSSGYSIVVYNPNEKQINVMKLEPDTKVLIPGYGFDSIDKSLFGGVDSAMATATNLTGAKIDRYITMDFKDYKKSVSKSGINQLFNKIFNTNINDKDQVSLSKNFKAVKKTDVSILEVPVTKLKVGTASAAQPKKDELKRISQVLWGKLKTRPKVIILNGMGKVGVGGKVGQTLVKNGFEILDIKNAKSFNYNKTIIALYTTDKRKEADTIKKLIKVGKIEPSAKGQNFTDITIIIGKDYR